MVFLTLIFYNILFCSYILILSFIFSIVPISAYSVPRKVFIARNLTEYLGHLILGLD